ncbi:MAG: ribonuclease Z [Saprospiraceae bacterium]|nr:ribonuclease Z [Saprospiraceae bacterium]
MNTGPFELLVLGSNGALPAYDRFPSSQLLNIHEHYYLIDCGEGTQFQLKKYGVRLSRIHRIFITHLHGDHIYGLPGLITTFQLLGRIEPLDIFGPAHIEDLLNAVLSRTTMGLQFELRIHPIHNFMGACVYEDEHVTVRSLPLDHKVPCSGFLFQEKQNRKKLHIEKIQQLNIPLAYYKILEAGEDIQLEDGRSFANESLVLPAPASRKFAYCTDTRFNKQILPFIQNVDLLFHETTYLDEMAELAYEHGHSTARQAAEMAKLAKAKQLLCGHYSSRYEQLEPILEECKSVFDNTILGKEGLRISIPVKQEEAC